jgi:rfaE bifunctional protein nucleotidyltransferase chain/domain
MPSSDLVGGLFGEAKKLHLARRFAEAEQLYSRVLGADDLHADAWHHLGLARLAQKKLAAAADAFRRALEVSPNNAESLTQLGIVLARQDQVLDAIALFRQAVEIQPQHAVAHNNLGTALNLLGQRDEGFACYQEAVRLQPAYAEAQYNVAVALAERDRVAEALAAYDRALKARPDYTEALYSLGTLLVNEGRPGDGIVCLEQAVRLSPKNPETHNNLGMALAELGRFEESIASCDAALRLRPLDPKAHSNRGNALVALSRFEEALASYDYALRLQPDYSSARWNRSLALLGEGDYERGWAEYESRWQRPETKTRQLPRPRWDGGELQGKTIFLWCEQGVGDTFQFARYAAQLKRRGATVWQECPAHLVPLLSTCPGIDRLFAERKPVPVEFDCHAPLMSLPFGCGTTVGNIPAETPYLFAEAAEVEHWRRELGDSGLKIGITWQGNPKHRWDRHRSFSVQRFRSLALVDGVRLYSLQKGTGMEQLAGVRFPLTDLRPKLDERGGGFEHTAAVIQALDLVVTCDSAVAHLAGALGKPVWTLLSALSDWRWLRGREDTPWYPTMQLFRQKKLGDWDEVFERVCLAAETLARSKRRPRPAGTGPQKLADWPALLAWRAEARAAWQTVVWTSGCFDLLHVGHVRSLQAARALGDVLVVGVNSDASVRRLKGPTRPLVPAAERVEVLAALGFVDRVVVFDEDTPAEALARLRPDIHCKGADYAPPDGKPIPEAAVVTGYGGRVEFLPLVPGNSTSDLVERIQQSSPAIVVETADAGGQA